MSKCITILILGVTLFTIVPSDVIADGNKTGAKSLYHRLGGYDVIAVVVNDFSDRFVADPLLKPFVVGFSEHSGRRQLQNFILFFCEQAGGPCFYPGVT